MQKARRLKQSSLRGMNRAAAVNKQMEAAKKLCRTGQRRAGREEEEC